MKEYNEKKYNELEYNKKPEMECDESTTLL